MRRKGDKQVHNFPRREDRPQPIEVPSWPTREKERSEPIPVEWPIPERVGLDGR